MAAAHLSVAVNFCSRKPFGLNGTGSGHAFAKKYQNLNSEFYPPLLDGLFPID
jgi:hypothetical protein